MGGFLANPQADTARQLVDSVGRRLRIAAYAAACRLAISRLWLLAIIVLLTQRCFGVGRDLLSIELVCLSSVAAMLVVIAIVQVPTSLEVARKIDVSCGTSDLFLTLAQLETAAGNFQPVIAKQASSEAMGIRPGAVVPWNWRRPLVRLLFEVGIFALAFLFLPRFDLFSTVETSSTVVAVRRELHDSRRETANRVFELSAQREASESSEEFNRVLAELATELQQLTTERAASAPDELNARQRMVESRWREVRNGDAVSRVLEQARATQFLGSSGQPSRQWMEELAEGRSSSIDKTFDDVASNLEQLGPATSDVSNQELGKQIRQAMAELQRFAGNQLQSQPMETAMRRAMGQLDSSRLDPALKSEAIEAAKESVELAQNELHEIANEAAQLASLEQALNAIQSAKQMAQQKESQPSETPGRNERTIQEFVEQYADLQGDPGHQESGNDVPESGEKQPGKSGQQVASAKGEKGDSDSDLSGKSTGSRPNEKANNSDGDSQQHGAGRSVARENATAETEFRDAREAAVLEASRRLMAMRRQGLSDSGKSSQEYRELVKSLQKRVSTAIEVEEIPPGYVSGIRSYFDSLDQSVAESGGDSNEAGGSGESGANISADGSSEASDEVP